MHDHQVHVERAATSSTVEERLRLVSLLGITFFLIGLCILIAFPFLAAITWGIALGIIGKPIHAWVLHRLPNHRNVAAILTTVFMVLMILVPLAIVSFHIAQETSAVAEQLQHPSQTEDIREQVADVPVLGRAMAWMERMGLNVEAEVRKLLVSKTADLANVVQGSVLAVIQFLMTVFILYYLFRDREQFRQSLREHLPLSSQECDVVSERFAGSVHAGLYATFITSLVAGITGGVMFWLVGLSAPVLWGSVMFVLSLLPIVGTGLVWVPAVVFLLLGGHWMAALAIVVWGILTFILVDNLLFMRLAGNRMRLHEVPTLLAFLGGIAIFGIAGMVLGPAILSLTEAVFQVWRQRLPALRIKPLVVATT